MAVMVPSAVTVSVRRLDAILLALGLAGEREVAVGGGSEAEVVDFFFELGVAEEKAQRRAQVVELLGGDALHLRVALGVEPGIFAVEQEELAGGGAVVPLMRPGLSSSRVPLSVRHMPRPS